MNVVLGVVDLWPNNDSFYVSFKVFGFSVGGGGIEGAICILAVLGMKFEKEVVVVFNWRGIVHGALGVCVFDCVCIVWM